MLFDELDNTVTKKLKIKVFGIGSAGCKSVNSMMDSGVRDVEFYQVDTDAAQLRSCTGVNRIIIGKKRTRLQRALSPKAGEEAALESIKDLKKAVSDSGVVFVVAGLGGGCGTGASPIIARLAQEQGSLVIGVVTNPFPFEKPLNREYAEAGLNALKGYTDTVTVIENANLLTMLSPRDTVDKAFALVDASVEKCVRAIAEVMTKTGKVNIDLADITTIMKHQEVAYLGIGLGKGKDKIEDALKEALINPLLNQKFTGARKAIVSITSKDSLSMLEVSNIIGKINAANLIPMNIIYGQFYDNLMESDLKITIIATGYQI